MQTLFLVSNSSKIFETLLAFFGLEKTKKIIMKF